MLRSPLEEDPPPLPDSTLKHLSDDATHRHRSPSKSRFLQAAAAVHPSINIRRISLRSLKLMLVSFASLYVLLAFRFHRNSFSLLVGQSYIAGQALQTPKVTGASAINDPQHFPLRKSDKAISDRNGRRTGQDGSAIHPSSRNAIKFMWGIHSDHHQYSMRQAIRETYLNDTRTCAVADVISNKKRADHCDVMYAFLITPRMTIIREWEGNAVPDPDDMPIIDPRLADPAVEPDVTVLRVESTSARGFAWLKYATHLLKRVGLGRYRDAYVVHTNVDVVVWPHLIADEIMRKNEHAYRFVDAYPAPGDRKALVKPEAAAGGSMMEYGTVQIPYRGPRNGICLESITKNLPSSCGDLKGRMLLFSRDLAQAMSAKMNLTSSFEDPELAMLDHIEENDYSVTKRYALGFLGAYHSPEAIRDEWASQERNRQVWKETSSQLDHAKILAVTGKFGRRPGYFNQTVSLRKYVLVAGGLQPEQIIAYDSFTPDMIHDPKWKQHLSFLYNENETEASSRGGGYWMWKPLIILDGLDRLDDGDFLLYSDVDVADDWSWKPELLTMMDERKHNVAAYLLHFYEADWNKRDVYERYCPDRDLQNDKSLQYWGAQLFLRKSPGVMEFVRSWAKDVEDYHVIDDSPSIKPNFDRYQEHRHDQSVMSLLLQCRYGNRERRRIDMAEVPGYVDLYSMSIVKTGIQQELHFVA